MRNKVDIVSIVLMGVVCACAGPSGSAQAKPDWVKNRLSSKHPEAQYLLGIGRSDIDADRAADNARAELAKIFQAQISQQTKDWQQYTALTAGGKTTDTTESKIQQMTKVTTQKALEGVVIADTWEGDGAHWALAVLDRVKATATLQEKIEKLDNSVKKLLDKAELADDKVSKIKKLKKAIDKLMKREIYNTELRIVNRTGRGVKGAISLVDVKAKLDTILSTGFAIGVLITGNSAEEVRDALVEGLTKQDFRVAPVEDEDDLDEDGGVDILVKGKIKIKTADRKSSEGWKFVRYTADFEIVDVKTEKTLGEVTSSGKEGHLSVSEAEERAVRKLRKDAVKKVAKKLSKFIYGK